MSVEINCYDAFTKEVGKGNPAGIVFDADQYTTEEMQKIAKEVGFNECCFICNSHIADIRFRYFTPGYETKLCGHATIAGVTALMDKHERKEDRKFSVETLAGIIQVTYDANSQEVMMEQVNAEFVEFKGDKAALASAIGLELGDLDENYPIVYGSTGSWTLIVPVTDLTSFYKMKPENAKFPDILAENEKSSIHPIVAQCINPACNLHGRHFSSCYSETIEDSVTGTASGVMAAYYSLYMQPTDHADLMIEQGNEIGRPGIVHAWADKTDSGIKVRIAGTAVRGEVLEISW